MNPNYRKHHLKKVMENRDMNGANGREKFIEVHETCLTDFLKNFDGCIKIMGKSGDIYTIKVFIIDKPEVPRD